MIHVIRRRWNGRWFVKKAWLTKASLSFVEYEDAMILALQLAREGKLSITVYDRDVIKTVSVHPYGHGAVTLKDDQLNFLSKII